MTRAEGADAPIEVSTAERRRGIELVLDRQPEIDLDELQRILAKVGIVVDTDTLVGDLDALGYDVDDDTAGAPGEESPVVVAEDGRDDEDDVDAFADRRPSFAAPPPRDGADDDDDDDLDDEGTWTRQSLLIAGAVVLVVIVVAVFLATAGGDDDDGEDTTTGGGSDAPATAQAGSADATTTGPTEPVRVAPVGPGSDPALDVPETRTDDFERGEVGDFPDIATWELLSGDWTNTDGNLDLTAAPTDGPAVAGFDVGSGDVRAQVQVDRRASRSGLAFRIVDDRNFFVWATVPEYATTILFHVVDGEAQPVADSGLTQTGDGLPALGVNLVGDRAELFHDGVVVATYDGIGPADGATRIGVAALPGTSELPLFDEYEVLTPPAP